LGWLVVAGAKVVQIACPVRRPQISGDPVMMVINPDSVAALTYGANRTNSSGNQKNQGNSSSTQGANVPGK
jgi:hypothetical protein